jgi:bifunctional enzyme CysN/CysC
MSESPATPKRAGLGAALFEEYLSAQERKDLLRFIVCGSVDDGKSTLIGRLLYDSHLLFEDQLAALEKDSRRYGTVEGGLDMALLLDGLAAEREQGITIDVAYRFFATDKRKFIVADAPGHEQYTRNMATGASTADAAVILADARKGILSQTRRHSFIVSLMGIQHVVLAINKMDAVNWDRKVYDHIAADYRDFCMKIGMAAPTCIPLSALTGDNVTRPSAAMTWHAGPTLLEQLEAIDAAPALLEKPFRLPVQWINRPDQDFRGFCGTVASGSIRPGEPVVVLPSGRASSIARIVTKDGDLASAISGQSVTLTLSDEIDISRGDLIVAPVDAPEVADQLVAHVIWMADEPLLPERSYLMRIGTKTVGAQITRLKHAIDVKTLEHKAVSILNLNGIGLCNLRLDRPIPFDSYKDNRETGGFILIDRLTNATVGCGMIEFPLRRASNIHQWQGHVGKAERAAANMQKPCVLWFTGLSGAGKSTIADLVEQELFKRGRRTMLLDGDNVRHGLNHDLGFTEADRVENIRRVAEVAKLMVEAGLIVLVSFISPFRSERQAARALMAQDEFLEIFVDASLDVCEARDPKGLYKKARAGRLPNFTGIDSPYQPPEAPDLRLQSDVLPPELAAAEVLQFLKDRKFI